MAVRVVNSCKFSCDNFIYFALNGLDESRALDGWINGNVPLSLDWIVDINADDSFCPLFKLGHFLT